MGEKTGKVAKPGKSCPFENTSTVHCDHCGKKHRKKVDSSATPQPNIKRVQNF